MTSSIQSKQNQIHIFNNDVDNTLQSLEKYNKAFKIKDYDTYLAGKVFIELDSDEPLATLTKRATECFFTELKRQHLLEQVSDFAKREQGSFDQLNDKQKLQTIQDFLDDKVKKQEKVSFGVLFDTGC